MDLRDYLEKNIDSRPNKEKLHTELVLDFLNKIDDFNIKKPYKVYREVIIKDKKEGFITQSDIIILNSSIYIIEAKVLRPNTWIKQDKSLEKRLQFTKNSIRKQLRPAYEFFKDNFKQKAVGLGIYRLDYQKDFSHYFFKF